MDSRQERQYLLNTLLKGVSRSFYLAMRVLPTPLREPIAVAYLLGRTADTISDRIKLSSSTRLDLLQRFRSWLNDGFDAEVWEQACHTIENSNLNFNESQLIDHLPDVFGLLDSLPDDDRKRLNEVVVTLTNGMEIDLRTFPVEGSAEIGALETLDDLDRYTYYVAGCVGEFWTDMVMAYTSAAESWDPYEMANLGVRFGKALQMTNVLRDVASDIRIGRCYIPRQELANLNFKPEDLLEISNVSVARPLLVSLLHLTLDHYAAAERYILETPRRNLRLRLAMIWPVLIGLATLAALAERPDWLDPCKLSKVSRRWVYWMMARSITCAPSNMLISFWIRRLRARVESALEILNEKEDGTPSP